MARAAVSGRLAGRLTWRAARLVDTRTETASARTLVLDVPGWPGHLAGQHVDVRLTAADGYTAQRSYSIASPADGDHLELLVQLVPGGEVSPYLVEGFSIGDAVEIRGPIGGWFVWNPATSGEPVLLVGGGSGIAPLMAMVRARRAAASRTPFRLVYSVRAPDQVIYADELVRQSADGLDVTLVHTRLAPPGSTRPAGRIGVEDLGRPTGSAPDCFVCGPTGFVESVADMLVGLGHDPARIRTERFGPSGG